MQFINFVGVAATKNEKESEFAFGCTYLYIRFVGWVPLGHRRIRQENTNIQLQEGRACIRSVFLQIGCHILGHLLTVSQTSIRRTGFYPNNLEHIYQSICCLIQNG